jgi:hypothetical protein
LSEAIIFVVAGSLTIIEYNRTEKDKQIKAEKAKQIEMEEKLLLESRFLAIEDDLRALKENVKAIIDVRFHL